MWRDTPLMVLVQRWWVRCYMSLRVGLTVWSPEEILGCNSSHYHDDGRQWAFLKIQCDYQYKNTSSYVQVKFRLKHTIWQHPNYITVQKNKLKKKRLLIYFGGNVVCKTKSKEKKTHCFLIDKIFPREYEVTVLNHNSRS